MVSLSNDENSVIQNDWIQQACKVLQTGFRKMYDAEIRIAYWEAQSDSEATDNNNPSKQQSASVTTKYNLHDSSALKNQNADQFTQATPPINSDQYNISDVLSTKRCSKSSRLRSCFGPIQRIRAPNYYIRKP